MGFEEALGYSIGEVVRDKDGISATFILLDLASKLKESGQNLWHALDRIDRRYGAHRSQQVAIKMTGNAGARAIEGAMRSLRQDPPTELAGSELVQLRDIQSRIRMDCKTGASESVPLPPSNVLEFILADGSRVLARPSGTEPKIKLYVEVVGKNAEAAEKRLTEVVAAIRKRTKL
jgi:phosphomannomutase